MFTGIVREIGTVEAVERNEAGARLRIRGEVAHDLSPGDSVSVNGVCLTAATAGDGVFAADVMNQTLSLTTLGTLEREGRVNLEPAVRAGEPLGGHLVQGHVDGTGRVTSVSEDGFARRVAVAVGENLLRYVAERGSVAIDGVSLTVAGLTDSTCEIAYIPHTLAVTSAGTYTPGTRVNLEVDLLARYLARMLETGERPTR
jgi:riboflavin synthase